MPVNGSTVIPGGYVEPDEIDHVYPMLTAPPSAKIPFLAGSSLPLDRAYVAGLLGFSAPTANSLDTVGDRDGVAAVA